MASSGGDMTNFSKSVKRLNTSILIVQRQQVTVTNSF